MVIYAITPSSKALHPLQPLSYVQGSSSYRKDMLSSLKLEDRGAGHAGSTGNAEDDDLLDLLDKAG